MTDKKIGFTFWLDKLQARLLKLTGDNDLYYDLSGAICMTEYNCGTDYETFALKLVKESKNE